MVRSKGIMLIGTSLIIAGVIRALIACTTINPLWMEYILGIPVCMCVWGIAVLRKNICDFILNYDKNRISYKKECKQ